MSEKLAKNYLWAGIAWYGVSATVAIIDSYILGIEEFGPITALGIFLTWAMPTAWMWLKASKLTKEAE